MGTEKGPFHELIPSPNLTEGVAPADVGDSDGSVDYTLYLDKRVPVPSLKTITGKVQVFNEMRMNSTISGILLAFKSLCQTPKVSVMENQDDPDRERAKARAKFLEQCLEDMQTPFSDVISEILDMLEMGFKVMVPQFKARTGYDMDSNFNSRYKDGKIGWKNFTPIDPTTIEKWNTPAGGGYLGLTGITQRIQRNAVELPIPKSRMLLFRTTASNNDPTGKSILEGAYYDWVDLVDASKIQMVGLRRSLEGIPYTRIHSKIAGSKAPNDVAAVNAAKSAVRGIDSRKDNAFSIPSDRDEHGHLLIEVGLMGSQEGGGNTRIQDAKVVIDAKEQTIARSMLAQFMTIQGKGGSYALSKNQSEVFINSLQGYIAQIAGIINGEAIPRLFAINGEGTTDKDHYLPRISFSAFVKDDITEFFGALQKSIEMGLFDITPQVQNKAGQVLGIDVSGQDELLNERKEAKAKLQKMGSQQSIPTEQQEGGEEIPETTMDDITDPTLKSILKNE
jgi:hypothetical protein